jgi:hypothetical protein
MDIYSTVSSAIMKTPIDLQPILVKIVFIIWFLYNSKKIRHSCNMDFFHFQINASFLNWLTENRSVGSFSRIRPLQNKFRKGIYFDWWTVFTPILHLINHHLVDTMEMCMVIISDLSMRIMRLVKFLRISIWHCSIVDEKDGWRDVLRIERRINGLFSFIKITMHCQVDKWNWQNKLLFFFFFF